jgi:redox-sensitive bicupin YhaK (pirin superfamily)
MIQTIHAEDRYHLETDWLNTRWHFSFDHYYDPANVNFGPLRVFNDDVVAPGGGFPLHPHREMEIVTYIIDGALEHKDNLGNTGVIRPGEIQRMSAGTGVRHSEYNPSDKNPVHLLQLWIMPAEQHLTPSWEQKSFSLRDRSGKLLPIAVPVAQNGNSQVMRRSDGSSAVQIHQDATIYTSLLAPGDFVKQALSQGRRAYVFVIDGKLQINGQTFETGDQARITNERELQLSVPAGNGAKAADFLLLDLP